MVDLYEPLFAKTSTKTLSPAEQKQADLIAESLKALKSWSEWQKTELRVNHNCTPEEANLFVKEAIVKWGHSLRRDIDFDRSLVLAKS